MTYTNLSPEQIRSHAKELLANPVLAELLINMRDDAVSAVCYAAPDAHDLRQAMAAELRVIRDLQDRLTGLAKTPDAPRVKSIA